MSKDLIGYFSCDPETGAPVWDEGCVCGDNIFSVEGTGTIGRPIKFADTPVSAEPTDDEIIDIAVEPLGIDCDRMPYGVVVFARALLSRYSSAPVAAQPDVTQQTLDDVMAGIPARDAEIAALRKEIDTLRAQQEADKVDEERKNTDVIRMLCETLDLARTCHSAMLMSDPPQEMWKARGVDQAIGKALHAADYHRMIGEAHDAARKEQA